MILTVSILISCNNSNDNNGTVRSIYYWSTTMRMDSTKEKFIHDHAISRMYLRYFDVVDDQGEPTPNATLRFITPVPDNIEIIPVVFIVNSCMTHQINGLANSTAYTKSSANAKPFSSSSISCSKEYILLSEEYETETSGIS